MPSAAERSTLLEIAVGVLVDRQGRLLVAQRRPGTPGAGRWEFPGGKQEPGETLSDCLARELTEEIGVHACRAQPLIRLAPSHGPRPVRLHVWRIDDWSGHARACEGQELCWAAREALAGIDLLPATDAILQALFLPQRYLITPALAPQGEKRWLACLDRALAAGVRLIRLRDHGLNDAAYRVLAEEVAARAHAAGARVLVDRGRDVLEAVGADGLHWPASRLRAHGERPLAYGRLVAVSAHSGGDLTDAVRLGADFAVLSPVAVTPSHVQATPLGWSVWGHERGDHALPVYALGGLGADDIAMARAHNGQGVAAIRAFWPRASNSG